RLLTVRQPTQRFFHIGGCPCRGGGQRRTRRYALLRQMGASCFDADRKGRAFSFLALDAHGPPMQGHQLMHKGEADSRPFVGARVAVAAGVGPAATRSCGRWARPVLTLTVKVVPFPSWLWTRTVPPCRDTSSCTRARPIPVPSWVRDFAPLTRWKRSKRRGSS